MVWTALQKYSQIFIRFISGIILARLLTPYDYGCIGMLAIFMTLEFGHGCVNVCHSLCECTNHCKIL